VFELLEVAPVNCY